MHGPARKAIVIGLDGASMEIVLRMVGEGHAPNLRRLIERGVHAHTFGVLPTLTAPAWTSLATGRGRGPMRSWTS